LPLCAAGIEGTVVDVRVLSRKGIEKDERTKSIEEDDISRLQRDLDEEVKILKEEKAVRIRKILVGQKPVEDVKDSKTKELLCPKGKKLTEAHILRVKDDHLLRVKIDEPDARRRSTRSMAKSISTYATLKPVTTKG